ncbi:MAG TPA: helix-turn-helix domain-containing protein [Bacteroidales bacterium]|nr:helix-turn-helix domain-containing protein [Bacteroidales bacterium]
MENAKYVRAMSGEDIANELGISRQAVSQAIKKAVNKMYNGLVKKYDNTPATAFLQMQEFLELEDIDDIKELLKFLSKQNREAIIQDAGNIKLPNEQ